MRKVLVTATNYPRLCKEGLQKLLENGCEVETSKLSRPYTPQELKDAVGDVEGVIANMEHWDEEMFQAAPKLKVIVRFGTGYDTVDLEAAKRHGVIVANTPGLNAPAVAEHTIALLFSMVRCIPQLNADARQGKWTRTIFHELSDKTVGILGFGAVGQNVAKKISGFGVNVIAFDKYPNDAAAKKLNVKLTSFIEVIKNSDYILIHLPSIKETYHIINDENIAKMKDGVYVINTARGPLVDEKAICAALESGKLAGMASDVFESEPVTPDYPLFHYPNYICTPHSAGETYENYQNTGLATAIAVVDVFAGKEPQNRRA